MRNQQPDQSVASNLTNKTFVKEKFYEYIDVDNDHGISFSDFTIFGDRSPEGYKKEKLISKTQHTVVWLFSKQEDIDGVIQLNYHLVQQIPRELPTFDEKMECIKHLECDLY